ncbi:adiponectin receptor 1b [Loa loa]|nr:adiponectin receptor 1b [Loa loa]EFO22180.1 adiponectin receptor 1b [Loa loa]
MKDSVSEAGKRMRKFSRGHRRAFSVPNASVNRTRISVAEEGDFPACAQKQKTTEELFKAVTYISNGLPVMLPVSEDDDADLTVKISEEEINLPNEGNIKRGVRVAVRRIWEARWKATNFELLPEWLQDNEYLRTGHRPPLPSFGSCFKSIFSLHTETGNIWTHLYGCVAFIGAGAWFLTRPSTLVQSEDKIVFGTYFVGAVACLGLSFAFHTVQCHSVEVGKLFSKLDYTGISLLIVGSFIPWIYYGFYCRLLPMIVYLTMISVLGLAAVIVSLWDKFAQPQYRPLRAVIFIAMGLSSVVPALHLLITDGISYLLSEASLFWFLLMGILYITGAVLYATRTPEKCFPGKFDLWLQSHQLFHMFVVAAALVHLYGISKTAVKRLEKGSCAEQMLEQQGYDDES